jgi:hypothetical protein
MNKIDKITNYFRNLREDAVAISSSTNSVGEGGLTGRGKTLAGFDPIIKFIRRKKVDSIDYRTVPNNYRKWVKNIENK